MVVGREQRLEQQGRGALVDRRGRHLRRRGAADARTDDLRREAGCREVGEGGAVRSREEEDGAGARARRRSADRAVDDPAAGGLEELGDLVHRHGGDGVEVGHDGGAAGAPDGGGDLAGLGERPCRRHDAHDRVADRHDLVHQSEEGEPLGELLRAPAAPRDGGHDRGTGCLPGAPEGAAHRPGPQDPDRPESVDSARLRVRVPSNALICSGRLQSHAFRASLQFSSLVRRRSGLTPPGQH